ncbi:MAG: hypothetical protein ACLGPL_09590 [Acidobacteriota bacterium]
MAYLFSFLFPALVVATLADLLIPWRSSVARMTAIVLGSLVLISLPWGGIPLGRMLIGLNANFSIPLIALLCNHLWGRTFGTGFFDRKTILTAWIFGLGAGLILYPSALGLGRFDLYAPGFRPVALMALSGAGTIGLILAQNRFGLALMACMLAYELQLLESTNFWDYHLDPVYFIVSLAALLRETWRKWRTRGKIGN